MNWTLTAELSDVAGRNAAHARLRGWTDHQRSDFGLDRHSGRQDDEGRDRHGVDAGKGARIARHRPESCAGADRRAHSHFDARASKIPNKPIGVFLLVGPSGVGKTETALTLSDLMYGGERNMITINMSEFQEAHTVSTLKGSPPGYVGYGEGGVLTEAVRPQALLGGAAG